MQIERGCPQVLGPETQQPPTQHPLFHLAKVNKQETYCPFDTYYNNVSIHKVQNETVTTCVDKKKKAPDMGVEPMALRLKV